ncbi:4-hydroxy-tetrahydrodipicolinate reductase [Crassaminicella thermophila]|uniref:4-hydroxy-tetrahydrodipicolinate reductase n=1 Tax=Crassaminicella thermophila TaxID=2599308 RepID=A0A5C0SBP7_CRATE|nr:4-hydroxy-tetrahydrodipicolinate reductase [Crassaminicella thermophila]QEK11520.1 4-hydroxy-tetrahydrodipicolinate reductase [Crassaminicella thermophila]
MSKKIRVCQIGLGRTGKEISKVLLQQDDIELVMGVCSENSPKIGKDLGEILNTRDTNIIVDSCSNLEENISKYKPDVAIDFSSPEATVRNAEILGKMKVSIVVGTTGFNEIQTKKLMSIAKNNNIGIVHAPNITLGVNVLMVLSNLAASILESYDCTITEAHFKGKKDAPSGTAKKIANEILKGMNIHNDIDVHSLDYNDIPIHAIRAGGIIGKHKVILAGEHDKIEIIHESFSRTAFALGALKAVRFVHKKAGFFTMNDVLNLRHVISRYLEREAHFRKQRFFNTEVPKDQLSI